MPHNRLVEQLQSVQSQEDRKCLERDLQGCDLEYVDRVFKASTQAAHSGASSCSVEPYSNVCKLTDGTPEERHKWSRHGLNLVAQGKVAILLLAGGQGTRLGSSLPKGCLDVGLPSGKSLFQAPRLPLSAHIRRMEPMVLGFVLVLGVRLNGDVLTKVQAERILKLQQLASAQQQQQPVRPLRWLVMTSPFTHGATLIHFESHQYFGLQPDQVCFFQQGWLPCFTEDGHMILETPKSVAKAPDGNGGVFLALKQSGLLDTLVREGVESVDCYCVDNLLARVGDPVFVGYCHSQGAEVGARVVPRAHAQEKVGVFATRGGELSVVEYSELPPEQASATDATTGELIFKWSNICMHYFSVGWLQKVHTHWAQGTAYHIARKQIPSKDGPVQGIKLELFIFDPFSTASNVALMEVARSEHFAPIKNARGSPSDTPDTARSALLALGAKWVQEAGAVLSLPPGSAGVEVPPLLSYGGEGLEGVVNGKTLTGELLQES